MRTANSPVSQAVSRLQTLDPKKLCKESAVTSYLASTPTLKAVVSEDGRCFVATSTYF